MSKLIPLSPEQPAMSPLLDDELTALLEKKAFSPPAWQTALFFFALLLFIASLFHCAMMLWQEAAPLPADKWLELKEDGLHPLQEPAIERCLLTWGEKRGLPKPERILVRQATSFPPANNNYWYLIWLASDNSFNYSISGHLREYCQ